MTACEDSAWCKSGRCLDGRLPCPTPQACQAPQLDDAKTSSADPLPWLTPSRFWIGYVAGIVSAVVGLHLWARLS